MAYRDGEVVALPLATKLPAFLGARDQVYLLPEGVSADAALVCPCHIRQQPAAVPERFRYPRWRPRCTQGTERARMIALTFGALMAVSLAALLIWFVLKDPLFILYATMFTLQALYVAYLSGQGFDWPMLSYAAPARLLRVECADRA